MKARTCSTTKRIIGGLLLLGLLAAWGCAARQAPAVALFAPIPLPARPAPPSVILPAQDAQGRYCLTQSQVNDLAKGIRGLQLYADQLEAAIRAHNSAGKK
jgi:hypothetical protein